MLMATLKDQNPLVNQVHKWAAKVCHSNDGCGTTLHAMLSASLVHLTPLVQAMSPMVKSTCEHLNGPNEDHRTAFCTVLSAPPIHLALSIDCVFDSIGLSNLTNDETLLVDNSDT